MDSVIHFEIPAKNVKRAKAFYNKAFGWKLVDYKEMDYVMVTTTPTGKRGPKKPGAINGGMMKGNKIMKAPNVVLNVKSIEKSVKTVKKLGGSLVRGKEEVGKMGYVAYVKDPEGNVIGLWQNRMEATA